MSQLGDSDDEFVVVYPIFTEEGKLVNPDDMRSAELERLYLELVETKGPFISLRFDEYRVFYTDWNSGIGYEKELSTKFDAFCNGFKTSTSRTA